MRARPVDQNGDMMPIQTSEQLLEDAPAVAQIIKDRMQLIYGEWWEDETIGFRVPEFLVENVRRGHTGMLEQYISQYIADTEGVARVTNIELVAERNKLRYSCIAITGIGDSQVVEVDLSGIL